jgi:hypothetical protein
MPVPSKVSALADEAVPDAPGSEVAQRQSLRASHEDRDDVAVRSGDVKVKAPWGDSVPARLRIEVSGHVGSGNITARPPRRGFWAWLRREPRPYAAALPPGRP